MRHRGDRGVEAGRSADLAGGAGQFRVPVPARAMRRRLPRRWRRRRMSSNATSSTTAWSPRPWRRAPRSASMIARPAEFHLSLTGQGVHELRRQLADAVFRVPAERIRVVVPDVGGGFGMKNYLYPEYVLVLWAARKLGRPVRWVSERAEDFVSSAHGRDFFARARLALDKRWPVSRPGSAGRRQYGRLSFDQRARSVPPMPPAARWAASTIFPRCSSRCAAPSPTRRRSTPIGAPASPKPII